MVEIRLKSNSVKEINDFINFFSKNVRDHIPYSPLRLSKTYVMRNGQYKFFVEFANNEDFLLLKKAQKTQLETSLTKRGKKRGRKPKMLETL